MDCQEGTGQIWEQRACLEAFALYKAQIKEEDDSEAFITLLEDSQVERLFNASTQQDFFRGALEEQKPMSELELVRQAAQLLDIPWNNWSTQGRSCSPSARS